jgi:hypothetical protein
MLSSPKKKVTLPAEEAKTIEGVKEDNYDKLIEGTLR